MNFKFIQNIKFIIIILLYSIDLSAQSIERGLVLIKEGKIEEARIILIDLRKNHMGEPNVLFLETLLYEDAAKAMANFNQIVEKYPRSLYAEDALIRLSQYYYARGLYITAQEYLELLKKNYPKSTNRNISLGNISSLSDWEKRNASHLQNDKDVLIDYKEFTLQVGAFSNVANARKLKDLIDKENFNIIITSKVINSEKTLFLVWAGDFDTRKSAQDAGMKLKNKYGLDFTIIKK